MVIVLQTQVRQRVRAIVAALAMIMLGGCGTAGPVLPTYAAMTDTESLQVIAARMDSVKTISAASDLKLTNVQGETVTLDGAFVAQPPEKARLRAWKFGSAVFDLTILPAGVWAYAAEREGTPADMTRMPAAAVSRSIEMLSGTYFARALAVEGNSTSEVLVVVGEAFGRQDVRCEIDRKTLTPRRFVIAGGDKDLEIVLDRYSMIGEIVWAHRMAFRSADGEIVIRLADVELNGEVSESAFTPPGRATKLP